jgi:hypothetical protein
MRRAAAAGAALLALATAGCGGTSARDDLRETAARVGAIRSGSLLFSFVVTPRGKLARHPFGFRIAGPFAFGSAPTARVRYTQIANGRQGTATLVLERNGGYALVDGRRRALSPAQLAQLRNAASSLRRGASVDVSDWIESTRRCGDGCVEGTLRPVAAVNTMLRLSGSNRRLGNDEAASLEQATRRATYRVHFSRDHLLRALDLDLDLGFDVPGRLRPRLGSLVGARIELRLAVAGGRR